MSFDLSMNDFIVFLFLVLKMKPCVKWTTSISFIVSCRSLGVSPKEYRNIGLLANEFQS